LEVVTDATLQSKALETYRTNYNKTARYKQGEAFTLWDTVYNHSYCFGKISLMKKNLSAFRLHQRLESEAENSIVGN
jgi:hypothetical protein